MPQHARGKQEEGVGESAEGVKGRATDPRCCRALPTGTTTTTTRGKTHPTELRKTLVTAKNFFFFF